MNKLIIPTINNTGNTSSNKPATNPIINEIGKNTNENATFVIPQVSLIAQTVSLTNTTNINIMKANVIIFVRIIDLRSVNL